MLLVGLAVGKAWERYKLRDGKWIDRRRARESHHYVLGLNFLVANQIDLAIEELSQAARVDSDALEIHLILGNVHRERGQVARAIQVHQALRAGDRGHAARHFQSAIEQDPDTSPAYLNLGDVRFLQGDLRGAEAAWDGLIARSPERAYLAFDRLERLYEQLGYPQRFEDRCARLIAANPQDWRARLALGRHLASRDRYAEAFEFLLAALEQNPHGLTVHQAVWNVLLKLDLNRTLVQRYIESARSSVFFLDPHVCIKCHYRSTDLLWQCPHCHEWNTFVEERIAPAKEAAES